MALFVIGDIHGHYSPLIKLLLQARLIDQRLNWTGRTSTLCLVGDYVKRGPDNITVLDFLISLQTQAALMGGSVIALLGNTDVSLVATHRFRERLNPRTRQSFAADWAAQDVTDVIATLTPEHIAWLTHLPALALVEDHLILHADASFYLRYGSSIDAVNARFEALMRSYDPLAWSEWLHDFAEHHVFEGTDGAALAQRYLHQFGGSQLIHGHTPIHKVLTVPPTAVRQPYRYAAGRAVNVDGGIVNGGDGFVYEAGRS